MASTTDATTLVVPKLTITREHKLEDLARRLAKELDIKLNLDERHHGISAQTWLSGENDKYVIGYSDDFDDDFENIAIKGKLSDYPRINITYSLDCYSFTIDVPDFLIHTFVGKYGNPLQQPINSIQDLLASRVSDQIKRIELVDAPDGGMTVYNFCGKISQEQLLELSGEIIRYFLS